MRYEWHGVIGFTLLTLAVCLGMSSGGSALTGFMLLASGYVVAYYAAYHGWMSKRHRLGTGTDPDAFLMHRWCILLLTACIAGGVISIEVGVRKHGGLWGNPWLIAVHLLLVLMMVVSFLLVRFKHTGTHNPTHHRWYALAFMTFYTGALITGGILLFGRQ